MSPVGPTSGGLMYWTACPPPPVSWRNGARSPSKHLQGHVDTQLHVLHVVVMLLFNQILLAGTIPKETVDTVVTRFIVLLMIY